METIACQREHRNPRPAAEAADSPLHPPRHGSERLWLDRSGPQRESRQSSSVLQDPCQGARPQKEQRRVHRTLQLNPLRCCQFLPLAGPCAREVTASSAPRDAAQTSLVQQAPRPPSTPCVQKRGVQRERCAACLCLCCHVFFPVNLKDLERSGFRQKIKKQSAVSARNR